MTEQNLGAWLKEISKKDGWNVGRFVQHVYDRDDLEELVYLLKAWVNEHDYAPEGQRDTIKVDEKPAEVGHCTAVRGDATAKVCAEIQEIMETYREQLNSSRGVDTPGGLEHMGDVWSLLGRWDKELSSADDPACEVCSVPESAHYIPSQLHDFKSAEPAVSGETRPADYLTSWLAKHNDARMLQTHAKYSTHEVMEILKSALAQQAGELEHAKSMEKLWRENCFKEQAERDRLREEVGRLTEQHISPQLAEHIRKEIEGWKKVRGHHEASVLEKVLAWKPSLSALAPDSLAASHSTSQGEKA